MKSFVGYAIGFLFIVIALSSEVHGFENESFLDKSQILITNKYAERFCNAKADHYFEGLDMKSLLRRTGINNMDSFVIFRYTQQN